MDRKAKKFFKQDPEFNKALSEGKDLYAVAAARFFNCEYEDCLEIKNGQPNVVGKYRRQVAKRILCAMYYSTRKKWYKSAFEMIEYLDFGGYKLTAIAHSAGNDNESTEESK